MTAIAGRNKNGLLSLLLVVVLVSGCGIDLSYRPADQKTIRDYSDNSDYQKRVGVVALTNTTIFTSAQLASPFMTAFLSSMESAASDAILVVPGKSEAPPFLWNPPRIANGDIDVFTLSALARQEGMNAVVSPLLMDIRVRTRDTGFWFFKDVAYSVQIQTAAAVYDTATGARLALGILTDEVDIDEDQAGIIRYGQEVQVDDLVEVAEEMGEELGERMSDAINDGKWLTAVLSIVDGACVISAGSEVGIEVGDRFTALDGSGFLIGLDGQRYTVPGPKVGEIAIRRVTPRQSFGASDSEELPPAGSILIPNLK